jgi:hypothetical protein
MVKRVQRYRWASGSNRSVDGEPEDRPMEREEDKNKENMPKGKTLRTRVNL